MRWNSDHGDKNAIFRLTLGCIYFVLNQIVYDGTQKKEMLYIEKDTE